MHCSLPNLAGHAVCKSQHSWNMVIFLNVIIGKIENDAFLNTQHLRFDAIFSVPSKGLIIPGISSPNDKWSILWEKL